MKAALLIESLTGNTRRAGELIANTLQGAGWGITGVSSVKAPVHSEIQDADVIVIGTWVHGLFVVGQAPFALSNIQALPALRGKKAAVFATYKLNAGDSINKLVSATEMLGAESLGGVTIKAFKRTQLEQGAADFAAKLHSLVAV